MSLVMGKMSRTKGRNAERAVELEFQAAGFQTDRNIGGREQVSGDIATAGLAIEVRRREALSVEKWLWEHSECSPDHLTPILVTRTSRKPWMVALSLEDFLDLLKQARENE